MSDATTSGAQIGERIRTRLAELDMTQAQLAKKSGLERSTISRIVRGRREPEQATLACIAPVLNWTVAELLGEMNGKALPLNAKAIAVPGSYFEEVVKQITRLEAAVNDRDAKLRSADDQLSRERDRSWKADRDADRTRHRIRELEEALARGQAALAHERQQVMRLTDALGEAVTEVNVLRAKVIEVREEARRGAGASTLSAILAGVAAATGIVTAAQYLGSDDDVPDDGDSYTHAETD